MQPDDLTTYHVAKIFDTAGIFIYERFFSMPPSATSLDNTATGVLFGNSNIQFKDEGDNRGTPSSVRNVDFVGTGVEATFEQYRDWETDRKSTRLNSSHSAKSRMPSSA